MATWSKDFVPGRDVGPYSQNCAFYVPWAGEGEGGARKLAFAGLSFLFGILALMAASSASLLPPAAGVETALG